jgi:hypothetical protein
VLPRPGGSSWSGASTGLAVEAELELGRRERLGRALLDAVGAPTAVLDAHGRIVAVNRAWAARSAEGPAGPALPEVGQRYPTPGSGGSSGVTVAPLPEGGAIVTHRSPRVR